MRLNDAGRMVAAEWDALFPRFINIDLDAFVAMPNHIHGIIVITGTIGKIATDGSTSATVGAPLVGAQSRTRAPPTGAQTRATTRVAPTIVPMTTMRGRAMGHIVGAFKSLTTVTYTRRVKTQPS
jgi:REP-associated tyrosine transposase